MPKVYAKLTHSQLPVVIDAGEVDHLARDGRLEDVLGPAPEDARCGSTFDPAAGAPDPDGSKTTSDGSDTAGQSSESDTSQRTKARRQGNGAPHDPA